MSQSEDQGPARPDLMGELRFKIPLPIVIPLASLVVIAGLTIGFSRVLLALPAEGATAIAIATAANVLGACAYVAYRRRMSQATWLELVAVALYPVLIGVAIAQIGVGGGAEEGEEHAVDAPAGQVTTLIVAEGIAFDLKTITLAAGEATDLELENNDAGIPHNLAIYEGEDDSGKVLFQGEEFPGVAAQTYSIPPIEPGSYYFQCDVHPDMNGQATVK